MIYPNKSHKLIPTCPHLHFSSFFELFERSYLEGLIGRNEGESVFAIEQRLRVREDEEC